MKIYTIWYKPTKDSQVSTSMLVSAESSKEAVENFKSKNVDSIFVDIIEIEKGKNE